MADGQENLYCKPSYYTTGPYYKPDYPDRPAEATAQHACDYLQRTVTATSHGTVAFQALSTALYVDSFLYRQYRHGDRSVTVYGANPNQGRGSSGSYNYTVGSTNYAVYGIPASGYEFVGLYDNDGGGFLTSKSSASAAGSVVYDTDNPIRQTDGGYGKYWIGSDVPNVNVTAVFGKRFQVYFKRNGGTGSEETANFRCYYGTDGHWPRPAPSNNNLDGVGPFLFLPPAGKGFSSWNTKADGTGTRYDIGDDLSEINASGKKTLYAQWIDTVSLRVRSVTYGAIGLSLVDADGWTVALQDGDVLSAAVTPGAEYTLECWTKEGIATGAKVVIDGVEHPLPYVFNAGVDAAEWVASADLVPLHSIAVVCDEAKGSVSISPPAEYDGKWTGRDIELTVTPSAGFANGSYRIDPIQHVEQQIPDDGKITIDAEDFTQDVNVYVSFVASATIVSAGVERGQSIRGSASCSPSGAIGEGTEVAFAATPSDATFEFSGWYGKTGELVSVENPYVVTPTGSLSLYARFSVAGGETEVSMRVSYREGDETKGHFAVNKLDNSPTGGESGQTTLVYTSKKGSTVTLSASVNSGFRFAGWYVGDTLVSDRSRIDTFVSSRDIVARFEDGGGVVREWEGSAENKTMTWKSKVYVAQIPFNPSAIRVDAEDVRGRASSVAKVTVEMRSSPSPVSEPSGISTVETMPNHVVRRLPKRRPERYLQVEVRNDAEVDRIIVATSMEGLAV